ncbi:MAG: DUF2520 domain-containing protein [Ignavibacteriaceae bacterium]|nr:DUF2520 domain-containing protein [Ignavibacteriaceae bacterium]
MRKDFFKNIILIGTGRIAHSLAAAMKKAEITPTHILSRSEEKAAKFALRFGIANILTAERELPSGLSLYIIAVSDDAIAAVSGILAEKCSGTKDAVFIHLSGSYPSSQLSAIASKGGQTASFHIMQTFPDTNPVPVSGLRAIIETESNFAYGKLSELAELLNLISYRLNADQKTLYHVTGIFISNFLVGNLYNAERIFEKTGLSRQELYDIFTPILMTTVRNLLQKGSVESLSGPLERGDVHVIEKHIELLGKEFESAPDLLQSYLSQSAGLTRTASVKNPNKKEIYILLRKMLEDQLGS